MKKRESHDLVVVPSGDQLAQERLPLQAAQRGQHHLVDVGLEGQAVASVQLLRVVIGGLLGAHVVNGGVCERAGNREWLGEGRRSAKQSGGDGGGGAPKARES